MVQSYYDNTGLYRVYGPDKATASKAGEYRTYGDLREINFKIDLTTVSSSSAAPTILDDNCVVPKGARIHQINVIGETAATSSGNGTIDIGLVNTDRTTELDYNGLVAAMVKGSVDSTGENNALNVNSTYAGALIGTTTTATGNLTANTNTAVYQTGVLRCRLFYYIP